MNLDEVIGRVSEITDDGVLITEAFPCTRPGPRILWCNEGAVRQSGYKRDELIGKTPRLFQGPATDPGTLRRIRAKLHAWQPVREHLLNYRKDGTRFWVDLSLRPVADESGWFHYWVAVQRDVTEFIELQEELTEAHRAAETAQKRLLGAIEALPDAFVIYDDQDRLVLCNSRYAETYAPSAGAIRKGARFEDIIREGLRNGQYPDAVGREEAWLQERLKCHRDPSGAVEQSLPGERFLQIHEVKTPDGDTVGFRTDVTELRRQKKALEAQAKALEHAAFHDQLTELPNRKRLHQELERRLNRPREALKALCVMHVDLDRFKEVNDTLGHPVGDEVLRRVSSIMRTNVRAEDMVARVGGDEFVVVMDFFGAERDCAVHEIAQKLISRLRTPMIVEDNSCSVGASIGVAFAADSDWDADRMMSNADIALYEAKRAGKGVAVRFQPAMRGTMERRHALIQEIETAVAGAQFVPYFQPKIALADGSVVGFEVLARWHHPKRGVLPPSEFLALAEETSLLESIDRQAISGALDTLVRLRAQGWIVPHVAVNASALSLRNPEYAADLRMAVAMRGLESADVRVEVVEDTLIARHDDPALGTLCRLAEEGFRIDLDDFGTGYASLASLANLELSGLKIDIELVRRLDETRSRQITEAIVGLAKSLGIEVTAEGVETARQFTGLRAIGCDFAQGFSISPPLAPDEIGRWLSSYGQAPRMSLCPDASS